MKCRIYCHLIKRNHNLSFSTSTISHVNGPIDKNPSLSTTAIKIDKTFHKRPLPPNLIALSSSQGKLLFKEAMELGGMESYFALSEQFITQSEPAYCSLSSLAMVLNALNYDIGRVWKGSWRWVSEEMLQCETTNDKSHLNCCHSIEKVKSNGMDFNEFESLARCHEVNITSQRVTKEYGLSQTNYNNFKILLNNVSSSDKSESFLVVNFSRKALGQTGDGHFRYTHVLYLYLCSTV